MAPTPISTPPPAKPRSGRADQHEQCDDRQYTAEEHLDVEGATPVSEQVGLVPVRQVHDERRECEDNPYRSNNLPPPRRGHFRGAPGQQPEGTCSGDRRSTKRREPRGALGFEGRGDERDHRGEPDQAEAEQQAVGRLASEPAAAAREQGEGDQESRPVCLER